MEKRFMVTGPNPDSFQRALARFKSSLAQNSPELIDQFSVTSLRDVRRACLEIQDQQGQNGCLRRMRRIEGFIEAMDQLGKTIEVFLNVNELVCFVWGPVKFLLGVAKEYLDSFDKLLDVYVKVGDAMPGLMVYQSTFEKHPPLATVLEDYYSDILQFHEAALRVFTRPKWKTVFKSVWKTFDAQFKPILNSLSRRRQLLESEKGSAALHEISNSRKEIADLHEDLKKEARRERLEKHKWRLSHVKGKLEAPDYQLDQEMATEDRNGTTSGVWMLRNPDFQKWADKCTRGHEVLYLNGIPGAGKTTLVSSIVERLLEEVYVEGSHSDTLVAYFYFKHNQVNKQTHNSFLRALLEQIITRDPALSDHLFDELASINGVKLRSTRTLESLVVSSLEHFRICHIVMDGLDEAAPGEADKLLKWLLPTPHGQVRDTTTSIRLLFCGQRDGVLDERLSSQPCISLESAADHDIDIANYCAQLGARIRSKFSISSAMENRIVAQVTAQANGMFLYARVVLENLLSQTRLSGLKQELEPSTFPKGIERAYERVAVRIFQDSPQAEREDAAKVLGWLTCAERLLRWREIQAVFCIDPVAGQVDYNGERLRLSCKQLCGSLVDIHYTEDGQNGPDDIVKIVHGTARDYLIQKRWINLSLENAKAATFCFRYLTSKPILHGVHDTQVWEYAKQGYYAFQDYSVQYCLDHFLNSVEQSPSYSTQLMLSTTESARDFLKSYSPSARLEGSGDGLQREEIIQFIKGLPKESRDRDQCFDVEPRTVAIRRQIEQLRDQVLTTQEREIIKNLYGHGNTFKCPKSWCSYFTAGFATRKDRVQHVNCHERPFFCPEEGCFASHLGFNSQEKLNQHCAKYHCAPSAEVRFPRKVAKGRGSNIHSAVAAGDAAAVVALLDSGIDPNASTRNGNRPLFTAATSGHFEVCKQLLARGATLCYENAGRTAPPVEAALLNGSCDIIHLFLSQPELRTNRAIHGLPRWIHAACHSEDPDVLDLVLDSVVSRHVADCELDEDARGSIRAAALQKSYVEFFQCLLEHGFFKLVTLDALFAAEDQDLEDIAGFLRRHLDNVAPPYSLERAHHLLSYLGFDSSYLSGGRTAILQRQSPAEQRRTARRYELALRKQQQKMQAQIDYFPPLRFDKTWLAAEEAGTKIRALGIALEAAEGSTPSRPAWMKSAGPVLRSN